MTPLENKKLIKGALEELSRGFIPTDEVLKTLIAKAFLAGEQSGKNKAVNYIDKHINDGETRSTADFLVYMFKLMKEARTS